MMTDLVKAHTAPQTGMAFYNSLAALQRDVSLLGYISVIKRAWEEIDLDGILCLDGRPVLYLKEYNSPISSSERIVAQRRFWNQGVANVLVLADPTSVYIYSGLAKPPRDQSPEEEEYSLVEKLTKVGYVQRIQSFYHDLATGNYYETKKKYFDPDQSVDSWLLDNLRALRNALIEGEERLETKRAHAFIGRMLFLCYLLDRGIVPVGKPDKKRTGTMVLAEILEGHIAHESRITCLYDELFSDLKGRFNGNMFDQNLDQEKLLIRPGHIEKLIQFLGGHDVASGQRTLGFWPYDFKMIPVETISAIYQDFLAIEDRGNQHERGAFYTPRFLAEMVVDTAVRENPEAWNWSYLDPSCGSGIFLVILFTRLANRWVQSQTGQIHYVKKAKALQDILARQIRGVDVEETACRIACFSLYLAYLDFFNPPDIKSYMEKTGQPLPKLLNYGDTPDRPPAVIPVIHKADFFDDQTLTGEKFDCVIGNPPWEGRQSKQLAQKFMQEAPRFLKSGGTGCLLLPSKILQNQTDAFQAEWLQQITLERVIQLSDYRRLLFQNALCPAMIARFRNAPPQLLQHKIEFTAPKFNRDGLRQGIITVNPSARSWLPLADILAATRSKTAPIMWKRHLWGTPRDQKLLDMLDALPKLLDLTGSPNEGKRWTKGMGFQPYYPQKAEKLPNYPQPRPNPWSLDTLFTRAGSHLQMFLFPADCITFRKRLQEVGASTDSLRRAPSKKLFKAPLVLVSKGFGKVAYCDFDVLFEDALRAITGPYKDADLLIFLTAYLRSNLARYFLFHTSANWGTERDQVHLGELLRIPFPLPEDAFISPQASHIVKQVVQKVGQARNGLKERLKKLLEDGAKRSLFDDTKEEDVTKKWICERKKCVAKLQSELDLLIYNYFGLTEQEIMLVEDTIHVFEPSSTPTTWRTPKTVTLDHIKDSTVKPYADQGLKAYADTLTETLNKWAEVEGSAHRLIAKGGMDDQTGLAMVTLNISRSEETYQKKAITANLAKILKEFYGNVAQRRGTLLYERDILLFQGDQIHIIRPDILLNWTRTAALNDAARIYGEIALAGRED
ncbi:MAG: N-6 DNA methylase [Sulfurimicrobium sp.]|nr:N-6 DNA methylase [Sulfurimicrobium sp.]